MAACRAVPQSNLRPLRAKSPWTGRPCFLSPNGMANKHPAGRHFAETPLNLTEEAIDRDSTGPSLLARVNRLKRLLARLERRALGRAMSSSEPSPDRRPAPYGDGALP